jgi:hypothetical protein
MLASSASQAVSTMANSMIWSRSPDRWRAVIIVEPLQYVEEKHALRVFFFHVLQIFHAVCRHSHGRR